MNLVEGLAAIGVDDPPDGATAYEDVDAFVSDLAAIGDRTGCAVQPFDARLIVDTAHLESAVAHANRAVARGEAVADDRAVEILCYAAGRRQIQQAMQLGVDTGITPVVVVIDDGRYGVSDDGVGGSSGDEAAATSAVEERLAPASTLDRLDEAAVRSFFDIGDDELAAVQDEIGLLVRERVALLDVEK